MKSRLKKVFNQFSSSLGFFATLEQIAHFESFSENTIILKEGGYVKHIPIVIEGLVKVYKEDENGNEFLLYYITPGESCILSIVAAEKNEKSKIIAKVEEDSSLLLLPVEKLSSLQKNHSEWGRFVYELFDNKFYEVINQIKDLAFYNTKDRLYKYLKRETQLKNTNVLHHSHQEIANELGTSREVISRLLKKIENEGNITLSQRNIKLL